MEDSGSLEPYSSRCEAVEPGRDMTREWEGSTEEPIIFGLNKIWLKLKGIIMQHKIDIHRENSNVIA